MAQDSNVVMVLFDSELRTEMFVLLELAGVRNYTHLTNLHGSSATGKKEGTVAWPGTNEILLLILTEDERSKLKSIVTDFRARRKTPPGLLSFGWKLAEMF